MRFCFMRGQWRWQWAVGAALAFLLGTRAEIRAAVYVVDQAAAGAADENPGTEDRPFKTVRAAAGKVQAGDTVYVMAGAYEERVTVRTSGEEGKPIVFRGVPVRGARIQGFDLQASYVQVEGFEITAPKPAVAVQLADKHCAVLDNYIHDMMVGVSGTLGTPDAEGIRDYSAVEHNWIAYNRVYHCEFGFMLGGNDWLVENNEVTRLFMYADGKRFDDCDYTRFFGKGCVQRGNYYHGSRAEEIRVAHVDCLQTFCVNGEISQDLLFENNTCFDFHQMCMVESAPHIGNVRNWTLRGNIVSAGSKALRGGWGPDIIQTLNVTIDHNTISGVRWATIGLRGKESTSAQIRNNILSHAERSIIDGDQDFTHSQPASEFNLTFDCWAAPGDKNVNGKDPLFVDSANRNFRLQAGSPAVGARQNGETIGALPFPNVYYVDPRHPAASDDPGWGYPAVPLRTLAKACALAKPGETVILRGGTYRETLSPKSDNVTIKAMPGENVRLSGADVLTGWNREPEGSWSVPMPVKPKRLLRDGKPWKEFSYERRDKKLVVRCGDPRLHLFENVVRKKPLDLAGHTAVHIEGISVTDAL